VTHEYTLLLDATVLPGGPGGDQPPCEAIAWAGDTILALGSTDEVTAISRGDSHVVRYPNGFVVPVAGTLEVGGPADLDVLGADPRPSAAAGGGPPVRARVRAGRIDGVAHPR
jgi:hypothetical protein